jgi:hypothetical protein
MTWTAPQVPREDTPLIAGEREALEAGLNYHRATLLGKCAGLTAQQLRQRAMPPSPLTLLGLVRHMTVVERWWFRMNGAGQDVPFLYTTEDDLDADFNDIGSADAAGNLAAYWQEVEACREAMRPKQLDDVVPSRGHHPERVRDIRWIYLHMIMEYARHNGHADILREQIDGATGD